MNNGSFDEVILAGASSIFGLENIRSRLLDKGVHVRFIETSEMIQYNNCSEREIEICNDCLIGKNELFIPVNEFWLTYGYEKGFTRISECAYRASRSKIFLAEQMRENDASYCRKLSIDEAKLEIESGRQVLIKPDCYYSGHGVKIVNQNNYSRIDEYIRKGNEIDPIAQKVLNVQGGTTAIWEYLQGNEFSADVLVYNGKANILRLCKKKIVVIDDMPCVSAYVLIPFDKEIQEAIQKWVNILFDDENISFAQFDFIIRGDSGDIIPIDFSCRVGGGISNLLKKCKRNIYEVAIGILFSIEMSDEKEQEGYYQFNILPTICGELYATPFNINIPSTQIFQRDIKRISRIGGSANDRLGCIIGENYTDELYEKVLSNLLVGKECIR